MSFTALEAFYLTEEERARLRDMSFIGRWLRRLWWLVKSLLMKLTPTERLSRSREPAAQYALN